MKNYIRIVLALSIALVLALASSRTNFASARQPKIVEFDSMVGIPQSFTGTLNPIRGINGGGLPWSIDAGFGELKADGKLEITVRGLVFAAGPNTGKNTIPNFRAIVSCLSSDAQVVNLTTDLFPATLGFASEGGGNADIETKLSLPQPCIAPLIFVTSPGGAWFATIGK